MKKKYTYIAALAGLALTTDSANAAVIAADDFNSGLALNADLTGRVLPTGTAADTVNAWVQADTSSANQHWKGQAGSAVYSRDQYGPSAAIDLQGGNTSTQLTISANVKDIDLAGLVSNGYGVGLGFYSATDNAAALTNFSGLLLDGAGTLGLVENGVVGTTVAYTGPGFAKVYYALSYDVDTTTGAISNISMGDSTADYSGITSTSFTNLATKFGGITAPTTGWNQGMELDDFQIDAVPEPSTTALLGLGGLALIFRRCK